jgi:plastocyanin
VRFLLAIVLVASVASGAPILVTSNTSLDVVHAERLDVTARFEVSDIALTIAPLDAPASGTVEITEAMTPGGTAVQAKHAVYTATVREREPASVASGLFLVELARDDGAAAAVLLAQNVSDPAAREGARIAFDVGAPAGAALFTLVVREAPEGSLQVDLTSGFDAALNYVWKGPDGTVNPDVSSTTGREIRFHIVDGEGTSPHNIRVKDADGRVVAGPSQDIENAGDEETLAWTPSAPGTYHYECRYHSTMKGQVTIA